MLNYGKKATNTQMQQPGCPKRRSRPPSKTEAGGDNGSERWAHSACCQKIATVNCNGGWRCCFASQQDEIMRQTPLLCHTGQDNYGDGLRTTVVAVIISNRRDLIVFPQCGGLLPEVSAVRVRSGHYLIDLLCIHHNTWSPKWIWKSARDELVIKYHW